MPTRRDQLTAEREHLMAQLSHIGRAPRDVVAGTPADREGGELDFDEGFADSGQVTAERGEVDALAGQPRSRRCARSTTRWRKFDGRHLRRVRVLRRADRRGPARGDAGGPALHHLRVAAPLSRPS